MIAAARVIVLAAAAAFVIACSTAAQKERAADREAPPGPPAEAYDEPTPGPPAEIAILDLYDPLALYEVLPLTASRADYSGLTVRGGEGDSVTLWLVNDKATRLEDAVYALTLDLSAPPGAAAAVPVTPARLPVANPRHLPTGEDIEDIGVAPAGGAAPDVILASGERGPGDRPVSWVYLMLDRGDSLELIRSVQGSPDGESVGNDGFEGAAVRRLPDGGIETFLFKERPAPTYILRERFAWDGAGYVSSGGPDSMSLDGMSSQSAAAIPASGDLLYVVDRGERRITIVDLGGETVPAGPLDGRIRQWIRYTAVDQALEGRPDDTPASLYGAVEAVALDAAGRLYLMTDNNESGNSRLMVLRRR